MKYKTVNKLFLANGKETNKFGGVKNIASAT